MYSTSGFGSNCRLLKMAPFDSSSSSYYYSQLLYVWLYLVQFSGLFGVERCLERSIIIIGNDNVVDHSMLHQRYLLKLSQSPFWSGPSGIPVLKLKNLPAQCKNSRKFPLPGAYIEGGRTGERPPP